MSYTFKFASRSTLLTITLLLSSAQAWTEDFTECNVGRAFGRESTACEVGGPSIVDMVESTQRTNNTAGFALKQTSWTDVMADSSDDAVYLNLTLLTPLLTAGNIVQIYASFDFPERVDQSSNVASFDTVQCSFQYHGLDTLDFYKYEVHDYYSTSTFFDAVSGNYVNSVSSQLDTAFNGTEDWILDEAKSTKKCYQSYCEFTCIVSRPLSSDDAGNDTQFTKGQDVKVQSGYSVWKDRAEEAGSVNNSKGISRQRTVTLVELSAQMLTMTTAITLLIMGHIF